jgi:peptidoglycan/xylan/chitin deacetylase (PgdA/CDA1 family)
MSPAAMAAGGTGAFCALSAAMAWAVRAPCATLLAPSFCRGVRTRRALALTFDDGPSEATEQLLEVLAAHRVRATFFHCGANVSRLPGVAREVASAGHDLGNHTMSHPYLFLRSAAFISEEMTAAQEIIAGVTGVRPRLFRPPYGVRWFGLRAAQERLGLTSVLWSTIGRDWKIPAHSVVRRLLAGAKNGAIFCLHDGRELRARPDVATTIEAVRQVIPELLDRGFHFETVNEILCPTS